MNYAELKQAIQDMTENYETTFVDNINMFITQAENRIYNTVQLPLLSKPSAGAFKTGSPYLHLPSDFLSSEQVAVDDGTGNYTFLLPVDTSLIRERYPSTSTVGLPKYYALLNNDTFWVGPTPDQDYDVELVYLAYPPSIVVAGTSWLGDNFSTALLYGSLVEAYTFMKGDADILAVYDGKYKEALSQVKRMGDGLNRVDNYRNDQVVIPVQ